MIQTQTCGAVRVLTFSAGRVNALDVELLDELAAAIREPQQLGVGAFVVTGAGAVFSAGVELSRISRAAPAEAIRLANDSAYGLSATVWTADKERGERLARRLEVGAVNVNDFMSKIFAYAVPMGGWKQSGIGTRAGGADGIRKYCRAQAITSPRIPTAAKEIQWYPSSPRRVKVVLGLLRLGAARGLRRFGITPRIKRTAR